MEKLKLRLDDLRVDTFDTTALEKEKGTVVGGQQPCTCYTYCATCPGCPTCVNSCNGSCEYSCNGTCPDTCGHSCWGTCNEYTCAWTCAESCAGSCPPDTCYYTCDQGMTCYGAIC
jgi:hypothetical protein